MRKTTPSRRQWSALALALTVPAIAPNVAFAFAEDMCMIVAPNAPRKGKVLNCFDIHCNDDLEFGSFKSARCTAKQVFQAGLQASELFPVRGRSMVHMDATYVIAQALGMSAKDAYWVAAYNQATDQTSYQAYDRNGRGLAAYTTLEIPGVDRLNFKVGGTFFHYVPPTAPTKLVDKLDVSSPTEAPLNHVRHWAFGERDTLCRWGLASEPFTNAPGCFSPADNLEAIESSFPFTDGEGARGIKNKISGGEVLLSETPLPADQLPLIKIGVYLHAMADRVSHHACCDGAPIERNEKGQYKVLFAGQCGQGSHAGQHALETGHKELPVRTKLALELTYDTLNDWLKKYPEWKKATPLQVSREALLTDVLEALKPPKAENRLKAFVKVWDKYQMCGLPGDEATGKVCFPDAQ